jgi:hypothetical protein
MFKKVSKTQGSATSYSHEEVRATPEIVEKFTKVAKDLKKISKKSDDFLYFSIVFLKAAESALIGKDGLPLKTASGETAWGHFDHEWKWHGNVLPHKNNNSDIFPESELKKATSKWIGMPLCRDHESSSVDGIRGIILDTHYDEKFKQVVGLCALDKVNYPDLARKVQTGLVRYGSMGTAVEQSVCTTCGNIAKVATDYCEHVSTRTAHGEINVGLNPIEYSLVVTPAEPEAVLLKCIASLKKYEDEFKQAGVSDVNSVLGKLNVKQAEHLESIMKTACGDQGCSLDRRDKIVRSFLSNNGLLKTALDPDLATPDQQEDTQFSDSHRLQDFVQNDGENLDPVLVEEKTLSGVGNTTAAKRNNLKDNIKLALKELEMNKKDLERRRQMRRKVAYHQGGSEGVEPNTFKNEQFGYDKDKHMHQTKAMGGDKGMHPGDAETKQKLSRAKLQRRKMQRLAYLQGGSEGAEPNTFKNEQFGFDKDKHMKQEFNQAKLNQELKEKERMKRASKGQSGFKTKIIFAKTASGKIDRANSVFKIYDGNTLIVRKKASDIWGSSLDKRWDWFTSKAYGQEVIKRLKKEGTAKVASLYKKAQELPPPPEGGDLPPPPDMGGELPPPPDMGGDLPPAPEMDAPAPEMDAPAAEEEEANPSQKIDENLAEIESLLDEVKDLKDQLEDGKSADIDVSFNVGEGDEVSVDSMEALASDMHSQLTAIAAELDDSADEMAMVSETYDNMSKLSAGQRKHFVKLATEAQTDSHRVIGEAKALCKMARKTITLVKSAKDHEHKSHAHYGMDGLPAMADDKNYLEGEAMDKNYLEDSAADMEAYADDPMPEESMAADGLEAKAMAIRRQRRSQLYRRAKQNSSSAMRKQASLKESVESPVVSEIKSAFNKKVEAEKMDNYKIKLRRAYDVAMDMQKKGFIGQTKTALDKQVDEIMTFDDNAFEAFKRSIASAKAVGQVKMATDLGGVNVGYSDSQISKQASTVSTKDITANLLSSMWDK